MFGKLAAKDDEVKLIFDHFRNVGICAVFLAATKWSSIGLLAKSGFYFYTAVFITVTLAATSFFLFTLNFRHGHRHLSERLSHRRWHLTLIEAGYCFSIAAVVGSIARFDPSSRLF